MRDEVHVVDFNVSFMTVRERQACVCASQTLSGEERVWSNCLSRVVQLIWL